MTPSELTALQTELNSASAALTDFARGPARRAADEVGAAFERAGLRIANALGSAAMGGEASFKRMAKVILEEMARLALDRLFGQQATTRAGSSGAGGASAAPVIVNFHMGGGGDPNAIARNQGQIAASIARAVAYGSRNL